MADYEVSLNDLSDPSGWVNGLRSAVSKAVSDTSFSIDVPDFRVPDRVRVGGDGGVSATFDANDQLLIGAVVVVVLALVLFRGS